MLLFASSNKNSKIVWPQSSFIIGHTYTQIQARLILRSISHSYPGGKLVVVHCTMPRRCHWWSVRQKCSAYSLLTYPLNNYESVRVDLLNHTLYLRLWAEINMVEAIVSALLADYWRINVLLVSCCNLYTYFSKQVYPLQRLSPILVYMTKQYPLDIH